MGSAVRRDYLVGDLLLGLMFVILEILPTSFIYFLHDNLGELRSRSSLGSLTVNVFAHPCLYKSGSLLLRVPMLWFINLTVATVHALFQCTFLSLCQFCSWEKDKTREYLKSAIFVWCENGCWQLLGIQSMTVRELLYRVWLTNKVCFHVHRLLKITCHNLHILWMGLIVNWRGVG